MKVLFITCSLGYGGAAKMLNFVAESLAERGHTVHIANIQTTYKPGEYQRLVSDKIKVHDAGATSTKRGWRRFGQLKKIISVCCENSIDIIIGFTFFPNLMGRIAGWCCSIPCVMSERGDPARTMSIFDRSFLFLINRSTGAVFQTAGAGEFYGKGLKKRGIIIPNPIFIKEEIPKIAYADKKRSVVSVGRLDNNQKRYDVMLKAFAQFHETHRDYVLKIYGSGPAEGMMHQLAQELSITEYVQFKGVSLHPMKDMTPEGMFLITSDYEGISNALLEAMAVGMPCVSTDHTPGGARMLIQDHENGLLAPIGDVQGLALAMSEFADDPELAEKCGENARDVIERFDPDRIIDMWENYIEKIYEQNRKFTKKE